MPVSFAVLECESEGQKPPRGAPDRRLHKDTTWCRSAPRPLGFRGKHREGNETAPTRPPPGAGTKELAQQHAPIPPRNGEGGPREARWVG
jgi:hypothetical protein